MGVTRMKPLAAWLSPRPPRLTPGAPRRGHPQVETGELIGEGAYGKVGPVLFNEATGELR